MAFRVLNENEIALLSDNQKKRYDEELSVYQERIAFIEQIEMLENVEIPPYEPQLKEIHMIGDIPQKNYAVPKDALGVHDIPECFCPTGVEVAHIKKAEAVEPKLPVLSHPEKVEILFSAPELSEPQLPLAKVSTPNISDIHIAEVNSCELPDAKVVFDKEFTFKMDKIGQPELPNAGVTFGDIPAFQDFKVNKPQVPVIDSPDCSFIKETNIPSVHAEIPSVHGVEKMPADRTFHKPEVSDVKVPQISKPEAGSYGFQISKHDVTGLPDVLQPICPVKPVEEKQYSRTKLPEVKKPICKVQTNQVRPKNRTELPEIKQIDIVNIQYKAPKVAEPEAAAYVKLPVVTPPKFAKIDSNVKGLPDNFSIEVPDIYEKWKDLLPVENELRTLEEANS